MIITTISIRCQGSCSEREATITRSVTMTKWSYYSDENRHETELELFFFQQIRSCKCTLQVLDRMCHHILLHQFMYHQKKWHELYAIMFPGVWSGLPIHLCTLDWCVGFFHFLWLMIAKVCTKVKYMHDLPILCGKKATPQNIWQDPKMHQSRKGVPPMKHFPTFRV